MRSGPTNNHRIIRMLNAGTRLEVLENAEDGWSLVRTSAGAEGWVLSRYLANSPSARDRLSTAETSLAQARQELQSLKQNLGGESQRLAAAQAELAQVSTANAQMKQQLAEAARGVAMAGENRELKKQVVDLQREIELLQNEAERLSDRSQRDWFITGALVIFAGFLTGIIVTRIRWRRKSSWSSL
jgi:SH3 domain protein